MKIKDYAFDLGWKGFEVYEGKQFGFFGPKIPLNLDNESIKFLDSLDDKFGRIEVATIEEDELVVLSLREEESKRTLYEIRKNKKTGEIQEKSFTQIYENKNKGSIGTLINSLLSAFYKPEDKREYKKESDQKEMVKDWFEKRSKYWCINKNIFLEKINPIKIYQGSISELQEELGKPVERVDTNESETFIRAEDTFELKVKAYKLGANAVVHYQPGSSIGTPVRFADNNS